MNAPRSLLHVRDLHVHYRTPLGTIQAVQGASFEVEHGQIVALVGESGCGKSATALAVMRLITKPGHIASGQLLFEGQDLLTLDAAAMRRVRGNRIAMVFQEPMSSLNPVQKIGRQIAEPLLQHGLASKSQARERAVELMRRVHVPDPAARLDDYPHQFSGGMRQRVMIGMAMACSPGLIVADEPTTALDVTVQAQVLELLREQVQERDTGLLLITHNLGVVARYADRVNVMYGGRVVESADADALYVRPSHPYTQGLLESVPHLQSKTDERLRPVAGQPYNPLNPPSGCSFHPRCPHATDRCRAEAPPTVPLSPTHRVACWLHASDSRAIKAAPQ